MRTGGLSVRSDVADELAGVDVVTDLEAGSEGVPHVPVLGHTATFGVGVVQDDPLAVAVCGADELHGPGLTGVERSAVVGLEVLTGVEAA